MGAIGIITNVNTSKELEWEGYGNSGKDTHDLIVGEFVVDIGHSGAERDDDSLDEV